jgi:predicted XRE-type DNA-binding protein
MPSTSVIKPPKGRKNLPAEPVTFEMGTGNVFADMGLPNAEVLLAKATLVAKIQLVLESRKLSTTKAAALLNLEPQRLERLLEGQTQRFTIDRLFRILNLLEIHPSLNGHAPIRVK